MTPGLAPRGAMPALVTPFRTDDAALDRAAARGATAAVFYDVPTHAGVASADGTVARPARLCPLCGADLPQLSGDDATAPAHLAMVGVGCVSVTPNVVPALAPLSDTLPAETDAIPVKAALSLLGPRGEPPRLPLTRPVVAA